MVRDEVFIVAHNRFLGADITRKTDKCKPQHIVYEPGLLLCGTVFFDSEEFNRLAVGGQGALLGDCCGRVGLKYEKEDYYNEKGVSQI